MQPLSSSLRNQLERTVIAARDVAEEGAWAALQRLAVDKPQAPSHLSPEQRELRVKLRARGRQLGDVLEKNGEQDIYYLHRECAYEYWHQMLFARFLAENQLLMHPDGVAVSLDECDELAVEEGADGWTLAARYASRMLPQIFRPDDPLLAVTYAPEDKQALEQLLADLPAEVFTANDSLGWVYQFWQTKRKKEVNDSGEKIGADELPAVTQLFTENYMVKFLLHNTLGAWWAGKRLTADDATNAKDEEQLRQAVALPGVELEYLRFVRGEDGQEGSWRPAAGTFDGWPKQAVDLKIMDPCCGSGHFLVAAFDLMVRIRVEEEGLSAADACDAVLRDNLHGLEIDPRCTQIAAFALAFAAWTFPESGGYRQLPDLHIACTGIAPQATEEQWIKLAEESGIPMPHAGKEPICDGLTKIHRLFAQASTLGSLIDPNELPSDLITADYETIEPFLTAAITAEAVDEETHECAVAASGIIKAADLLTGEYTLVITNVPYLGDKKQGELLKTHIRQHYADGKADLATAFLLRCLKLVSQRGTSSLVMPHNWLFLSAYKALRERIVAKTQLNLLARLGEGAFDSSAAAGAFVALVTVTMTSDAENILAGIDAAEEKTPTQKAEALRKKLVVSCRQNSQLRNPEAVVTFQEPADLPLLDEFASNHQGLSTGDNPRFRRMFWEMPRLGTTWEPEQSNPELRGQFAGRSGVLKWERGSGELWRFGRENVATLHNVDRRGEEAWTRCGIAVGQMRDLPTTLYFGQKFDTSTAVLIPRNPEYLPAIWAFCSSPDYCSAIRTLNQKVSVDNGYLTKAPFDLTHWQKVAAKMYAGGLPEPESDDPTQWLFHGRPENSTDAKHVAVARLLGYRWPAELDEDMRLSDRARVLVQQCEELLSYADSDGIVCLPAVAGERTASDRLGALLTACGVQSSQTLDAWLRDKFFQEHCQLFQQRPFIWHIWDGRRKDGFHALVNYHKLDRKLLEKLIYSHLGDWIARQKAAESRGEGGAEARRLAAEDLQSRLKLILEGEPPYDIFVRWKPLEEQPIGWDPDLDDGVRVNIRPFVNAGVLRKNPKIKWKKDRGKEPERSKEQYPWFSGWDEETEDFMGGPDFDGNRWNDCHYSKEVKQAARVERPTSSREAKQQPLPDDDDESEYEYAEETEGLDHEEDDTFEERPLRFDDLQREDILMAIRQVFRKGAARDRETAIREVFDLLPGERLTEKVRTEINNALRTASQRAIVYTENGLLCPDCRAPTDYARDLLKKYLASAMGSAWWEQEEAVRAVARYLGFSKATPTLKQALTSAIRGALRQGTLERDGSMIRQVK